MLSISFEARTYLYMYVWPIIMQTLKHYANDFNFVLRILLGLNFCNLEQQKLSRTVCVIYQHSNFNKFL
jgi:hypothetical protein